MQHLLPELISALVTILVTAFFLHLAASFLAHKPPFTRSILVAVLGSLTAGLIAFFVPGVLGLVLAVIAWLAVAAAFYNVGLLRALGLGLLAYLLFLVTRWAILAAAAALSG